MDKTISEGYKHEKIRFAYKFTESLVDFLAAGSFLWLIILFFTGKIQDTSSVYNIIILGSIVATKYIGSVLKFEYELGFVIMWVIDFICIHMAFWTHREYYGVFTAASTNFMFHGHLDLIYNDTHGYATIIFQIIIWTLCAFYKGIFSNKPSLEIFYTIGSIFFYRLIWFRYRQEHGRLDFKNQLEVKIKESNINSLLQVIPEGIIVMDSNLKVKMANPAFQSLFPTMDMNNLEYVKLHHHALYKHNQYLHEDIQQFVNSGTEKTVFGLIQTLDKKLECTGSKVMWNDEESLVLTFRDVTNLIEMEREGYKNLDMIKTIRGVSHELKTSINIIINKLLTVLDNDKGLSEETRKNIQISCHTSQFLLCSIRDILDYSNLKNNNFCLNTSIVNLKDLLGESILIVKSLFQTETLDVKINADVPSIINSDKSRLQQVLFSLISTSLQ